MWPVFLVASKWPVLYPILVRMIWRESGAEVASVFARCMPIKVNIVLRRTPVLSLAQSTVRFKIIQGLWALMGVTLNCSIIYLMHAFLDLLTSDSWLRKCFYCRKIDVPACEFPQLLRHANGREWNFAAKRGNWGQLLHCMVVGENQIPLSLISERALMSLE